MVQYPSSKPVEGGQWISWGHVGSFYITCTISHSCPEHYLRGPYGRNLGLPSVLSRYHQTLPLDRRVLVNLLKLVLGYRLNHLSMPSSSDSRVPPSVHQACHSLILRKVFFFFFLWKHKNLSRMISEPDAFSFDVFSNFLLWRSPKSFFEYHLGYSEVRASHESGLLLIGASAFSVPILLFSSLSVIYSVVFLRFYLLCVTAPNHSRQTSYITVKKDVICWSMGPLRRMGSKKESPWSKFVQVVIWLPLGHWILGLLGMSPGRSPEQWAPEHCGGIPGS